MDFKVTGTERGLTACQMDIKIEGLSTEILKKALEQAKKGRLYILEKMLEVLPAPREDYKPNAPRIEQIIIPKDFIGAVIGPGGKIIQDIQKESGATIVIDEVDNMGVVDIVAEDKQSIEIAKERILEITAVPEVGKIYKGKVVAIQPYGAFVEILPGKSGLLHISEIEWHRINNVEEVLKEGDEIEVKLVGIDPKTGKLKLSRKVLLKKPEEL
jgi:polyribonucleotide nucleotidyltransferase